MSYRQEKLIGWAVAIQTAMVILGLIAWGTSPEQVETKYQDRVEQSCNRSCN